MHRRSFGFALFSFSLIICYGCGGDPLGRHAVSGSIKVDGTPLADGLIRFEPVEGATTAGGAVVKNGSYSLDQDKGLPSGKYRVVVTAPVPGTGGVAPDNEMPGDAIAPPKEMIPPDWNIKSSHTIEVKDGGPFTFDFDIATKK
jgi:hypothetical protein